MFFDLGSLIKNQCIYTHQTAENIMLIKNKALSIIALTIESALSVGTVWFFVLLFGTGIVVDELE